MGDSIKYVDAINRIGHLMHMKSADSTLFYGLEGKALAERLHYGKGEGDAIVNIGTTFFLNGLYKESLKLFADALEVYKRDGNDKGMISIYSNMAVVFQVLDQKKNAHYYSGKSLKLGERIATDSVMSMIYANYVYLHPELGKDSVDLLLKRAENIANKFGDDRSIIMILQQRAVKYLKDRQYDKAFELLNRSATVAERHEWEYHRIVGLQYLADYYIAVKDFKRALTCYKSALDLANRYELQTFEKELLQQQKHLYLLSNNPTQLAYINEKLVINLEQELKRSKQFLGDYVSYYEQKTELEKLKQTQKTAQKQLYSLLTALSLSLLIVVYVFYLYRRMRAASNMQLELNQNITDKNQKLKQEGDLNRTLIKQIQISHGELNRQLQLRTNIMSAIGHDIRTPLKYLLVSAEYLQKLMHNSKDDEVREAIAAITESTRIVLQLLENMVDYSKSVYLDVAFNRVSIKKLIDEKLAIFSRLAEQQRTKIYSTVDESLIVQSNINLLSIVLHNLIDNAIKFTRDGVISVSAHDYAERTEIQILDSGPGFDECQLAWLNEYSMDQIKMQTTKTQAGLGLLIVKELCEILGIRLNVKNKNGAFIVLSLPSGS